MEASLCCIGWLCYLTTTFLKISPLLVAILTIYIPLATLFKLIGKDVFGAISGELAVVMV